MSRSQFTVLFLAVAVVLFLGGCGKNISLKGRVVFTDDGTPLTAGTVCFVTENTLARGSLDSNGTYTVGTIGKRDGLAADTYRIYILDAHREVGVDEQNMPIYEPLIDEKYMNPETSGLSIVVDRQTSRYDIQVERPVSKR